jgi:hypothetical protein
MKIALRLLKEFWLPAIVAVAWTSYNIRTASNIWDFKSLINIFGPSFFLASWATGQFFRVQKQASVEKNLTSIETRVDNLVTRLERHSEDFIGYSTGSDSVAYFVPMITGSDVVDLALMNKSVYPVFDIHSEVIDLDEPIDIQSGNLWTRHKFSLQSLHPNKILTSSYRFDLSNRPRLYLNIFIQTRTQGLVQLIRIIKTPSGFSIATKTTCGENTIEYNVPETFPGYDAADPHAVFK